MHYGINQANLIEYQFNATAASPIWLHYQVIPTCTCTYIYIVQGSVAYNPREQSVVVCLLDTVSPPSWRLCVIDYHVVIGRFQTLCPWGEKVLPCGETHRAYMYYWITLCFRRHCFCCSQIWRTRHRHILIFTRSNLLDSKGCQPFKKHICHVLNPFYGQINIGKFTRSRVISPPSFPAVSAVWQFVNGRWHLFRLNESTE